MIPRDFVEKFVYENFINPSVKNSEYNFRCPLCGDSKKNPRKKRFYLKYNPESGGLWNCFNCNRTGNFLQLYSTVKCISIKDALKEVGKFKFGNLKGILKRTTKPTEKKVSNIIEFDRIRKDCVSLDDNKIGMVATAFRSKLNAFLSKRRLPKSYPFYIAYDGPYKNRIIIPIFDQDNQVVYFQGRATYDDLEPKYMNPDVSNKKDIIMNIHKFNPSEYIMVTEGPLDALFIGNQGTCVFGSSIDDEFLDKISRKTSKGIVIALDNDKDGIKASLKIASESKFNKHLFYFIMPYKEIKDINQLVIEKDVKNVYSFILDHSMKHLEFTTRIKLR